MKHQRLRGGGGFRKLVSHAIVCALSLVLPLSVFALEKRISVGSDTLAFFGVQPESGSATSIASEFWAKSERGFIGFEIDVEAQISINRSSQNFFNPREFFFNTRNLAENGETQIVFGRKKQGWSVADQVWDFGIWEPRFLGNFARPQTQGLTGFFLERTQSKTKWIVFASPLFIPEMGVQCELRENGIFESSSPWCITPPQQVVTLEQPTNLQYNINRPKIKDVVFRPSVGASIETPVFGNAQAKVAYAFKPINQFLVGFEGSLDVSQTEPFAEIQVYPRVLNHHVFLGELKWEDKIWTTQASVQREIPLRDRTPAEWATQEIQSATLVSGGVEYRASLWARNETKLGADYVKVFGADSPDQSEFAAAGETHFMSRYRFKHAARLRGSTPFWGRVGRKFNFGLKWTYDFFVQGSWMSSTITFQPQRNWSFYLSADFLGVVNNSLSPNTSEANHFINLYRANDFVQGGFRYVF